MQQPLEIGPGVAGRHGAAAGSPLAAGAGRGAGSGVHPETPIAPGAGMAPGPGFDAASPSGPGSGTALRTSQALAKQPPARPEPVFLSPGPTAVPQEVRVACARQVVLHRSAEFDRVSAAVREGLRRLFRTSGRVVVFPCSGTGALEAAVVNTLSPGDRVLAVVMGLFGDRFAAVAEAYGLEVDRLEVPWGQIPRLEQVLERLEAAGRGAGRPYRAVFLTHSETSTGALLPLEQLVPAIRRAAPEALVLVDMVSSFAAVPVAMDAWGIDVAVTGSQKALMTPPGLGIVALGPRALEAVEQARLPRFTWDVRPYLVGEGDFPYTPAVTLWFGLQAALERIAAEGEENVYRRHRLLSAMVRAGVRALGLEPLARDEEASPTVTAVPLPAGVRPGEVIRRLADDHGVVVVSAQGPLKDRAFRIGHMGALEPADIVTAMAALDAVLGPMLAEAGRPVRAGAAAAAARAVWAQVAGEEVGA
ncbi:alanine--glyoxylate aminotransferase family protein [Thermaerobacter sp. PB12/4term]|uniref:pyridoxal-phosphate-dependent aminotransferase family protein n=1 Tax=Thermaerobacter sp. PB12/4term TaxID=2293838 RepID=UPI000E329930|nr:alanine--glyoxylate aminotransferase family protein [Thermaerobacter sp. PB12/4term]QIA26528.1 alanine--glyoxylate aminotransferase family protein [Thermaerobacter sp. PB12/4term]